MNNADSAFVIPANKAQDLLNVDVTPGGRSVKKRRGFGLSATLAVTTSPVHGVYTYYDASGNTVDLYFNDTRGSASVNGGSPAVLFSTGSNGATYQCVDSQGFAYCANSARTPIVKTNGVTATQVIASSTGTLVAVTQQRLATAGFAEAPNRVDFSKANDFTTWTVGALDTDPVQFTIVSPGSHLTHIVYAFGRIIWFKDTSFGYILEGQTQGDWQIRIISPNLGTLDNTSVFREGILYFRGNDGHIYGYDGSNYTKLTRDLQGTISTSQNRTSNSWTQTSQTDWEAGAMLPSSSNFTVNGALTLKGFSQTQTTSADFGGGTFDDALYVDTETVSGNLQTVFPETCTTIRDGTSGTKTVWSVQNNCTTSFAQAAGTTCNFTCSAGGVGKVRLRTISPIPIAAAGTSFYMKITAANSAASGADFFFALSSQVFSISDTFGLTYSSSKQSQNYFLLNFLSTTSYFEANQGVWKNAGGTSNTTLSPFLSPSTGLDTTPGSYQGAFPSTFILWISATRYNVTFNGVVLSSGTHTFTTTKPLYAYIEQNSGASSFTLNYDDFTVAPQTFTYTSPSFDTAISSPTWGTFTATTAGSGNHTFTSQVSANNVSFDSGVTATPNTALTSAQKRYIKLNALFSYDTASLPGTPLSLSDFTLTTYSTGTFYSAVKNASSLTSWDSFTANKADNGGSHAFYIRSSTNAITVTSSTPSWTALTSGALPTVSTGTYFQIRDDMAAISSTTLPSLSDFTQGWFEGLATDKSYATYFKDALWWSVVAGSGTSTNNRVLRYDFLNGDWYLYDLATNGMLVRNNSLYFGSASGGYIYKFGDVDNDNGAAINAYWRSKDFFGDSPFVDKELVNMSVAGLSVANSSATVTYMLNGSSATSYTMNLYDPNKTTVRVNKNLPLGKIGNTFRVEVGNNAADQPFEVYAIQYGLRQKTWIPTP